MHRAGHNSLLRMSSGSHWTSAHLPTGCWASHYNPPVPILTTCQWSGCMQNLPHQMTLCLTTPTVCCCHTNTTQRMWRPSHVSSCVCTVLLQLAPVTGRMLYGFSRDRAVPFWWLWQTVNREGVPVYAGNSLTAFFTTLFNLTLASHQTWSIHVSPCIVIIAGLDICHKVP